MFAFLQVVDGLPHGIGVFTCVSCARYEGEWVNGLRHGSGQFVSHDQLIYRGSWERGQPHGFGLKIDSESAVWKGRWEFGELIDKDESSGNDVAVQQRQELAKVKPYEQGLKPMPRFGASHLIS